MKREMSGIRRCEWGFIMTTVFYLAAGVVDPSLTLYPNIGETVSLPCTNVILQNTSCPSTTWLYKNKSAQVIEEVTHGKVKKHNSGRADRLSVGSDCSLIIHNVRAEDVGRYTCQQYLPEGGQRIKDDANVFLSLLIMSSSTPVLNPGTSVTLTCYLSTYDGNSVCVHSLIWLDEDGNDLQTDSMVQGTQSPCEITLTVTLHKPSTSRRFSCRLTNSTKQTLKETFIEFPSTFSDIVIPVAATLGAVLFLVAVIIIIIISCKKREINRKKSTADMIGLKTVSASNPTLKICESASEAHKDQPEDITYASIDLSNTDKKTQTTIIQASDAVTYASVGSSSGKGAAPDNLNDLYATVNKPL